MDLSQAYRWIAPQEALPPIFHPETVEEARHWLKERNRPQSGVLVAGSGSHWFLGGNPSKATDVLSLRNWDRLLDYSPGDMIVEVEAGCPAEVLQKTLREEGQFLPFLPFAEPGATVGGVVAGGRESPFSAALGGPRDALIGVEVLHPEGILSHAGGKVVKNVAGYDLCKLYCGSLGTLGVLTRLAFKVRPLRGRPATALMGFESAPRLLETALRLRDEAEPAAMEILAGDLRPSPPQQASPAPWLLAVRLADAPGASAYKRSRIEQPSSEVTWLEGQEEEDFWRDWSQRRQRLLAPDSNSACLLAGTSLGRLEALMDNLQEAAGGLKALGGSFQRGRLTAFFEESPGFAQQAEQLRGRWNGVGDSIILWKGSADLKTQLEVWDAAAPLKTLQRQLQHTLDPNGVLNPGRL